MNQPHDVRMIRPNDVTMDPRVNKHWDDKRSKRMSLEYDETRAVSAGLVVSRRPDGTFVVLDGQHRLGAARFAGRGDIAVPMIVMEGLSMAKEAEWVLLFQEGRKATTPVDSHRLGVRAGRPVDVTLDRVCESHGVRLTGYAGRRSVAAVSTARRMVEKDPSGETLDETLKILISAWDGASASFEQSLFKGLYEVVHRHNGSLDRSSLTTKLSKTMPEMLLSKGAAVAAGDKTDKWKAVANQIIKVYNKNRPEKSRVPSI